jgi:hypothetical protein
MTLGPRPVVLAIAMLGAISVVSLASLWSRIAHRGLRRVEERLTFLQMREQRRGLMKLSHWLALVAIAVGVVAVTSSGVLWLAAGSAWGVALAASGMTALFWGGWRLSRREPCPSA